MIRAAVRARKTNRLPRPDAHRFPPMTTAAQAQSSALTYLDADALTREGRWPMLVGDPLHNLPPSDPLMVESAAPRTGKSPITNAALAPATSQNPNANPSNGHEMNDADLSDLEYACTFPLSAPKPCKAGSTCECAAASASDTSFVLQQNSPLCQPPGGGPSGTTQYFAKGDPGTRELLFARALGTRAAPASICPKQSTGNGPRADYGPALDSLIGRIAKTLH